MVISGHIVKGYLPEMGYDSWGNSRLAKSPTNTIVAVPTTMIK